MDEATIYDRKTFRKKFKEIYNNNNFNFEITDSKLNNIK